jgi:hypothetical protein
VDSGKTGSIDAAMQWERPVDIWVYASIALYVVLAVVGLGLYSPVLKRQIANYEASGAATAEFTTLSARSRLLGMVLVGHRAADHRAHGREARRLNGAARPERLGRRAFVC